LVCPVDEGPFSGMRFFANSDRNVTIMLTDHGTSFEAFCRAAGSAGIVFLPKSSGIMVRPPSAAIARATFHLFNFADFSGGDDYTLRTKDSIRRCGRVQLKADGWQITLAGSGRTGDLTKSLGAHGGYVITHVGQVVRGDGSAFSSGQLEDLLSCLHY